MWTIIALISPDLFLRQTCTEHEEQNELLDDRNSSSKHKRKHALRCQTCQALITSHDQAIHQQGQHEHAFFNPSGLAFEVRCFQHAPGCLVQGKPTAAFSWFAGYCWQYALCRNCRTHIGWYFARAESSVSDNDSFFALIAQKIV